ncbi:uncharacterized protein LOC117176462 [Belonocnema kinseyi]|uniref:uncharacterized protein LOC117176462 n=1 Tax=Belonocnema kinseyi TaxID=2817044 RepID=UPI00143D46A5|nr:uncharacterized protein LOC117176462 [Belonocnema kinseyi]
MDNDVFGDERLQRSTCPTETSGKMRIFWKVFVVAFITLILFLFCIFCCRYIYGKLRCVFSRNNFDRSRAKGEKEEKYCLCGDEYGTASFSDCYLNEKESSSGFKELLPKFKNYFKNRKEKKKEKLRYQQFQKMKAKLQKIYIDQQKKVKVNRQEEKILNSLTEGERDELGEMIREMKFLLDSDEETEKLLLSGKRLGTFIIDMKNLHGEKIARSHESNKKIMSIKSCGSKERSSLSDNMMILCTEESNKNAGNEKTISNPNKKTFKEATRNRQSFSSGHYLDNEAQDSLIKKENPDSENYELAVKSEFVKCYAISDSDRNCSSPFTWEINRRKKCLESEKDWSYTTAEETELSTFRSEIPKFVNAHNLSPEFNKNKKEIQSDMETPIKNATINLMKSVSAIELGSKKSKFESRFKLKMKRTSNKYAEQNRHYSDYSKNEESYKNKSYSGSFYINSCRTSLNSNSSWNFTPRYNKRNSEKSRENFSLFKNSNHGDTESHFDLCETYDELGLLFSHHMKQQARPCYRNYCLLRRHLKRRMHDQRQCRIKKNYFQDYPNGQTPSCTSGNICRDTYDEFSLMKASRQGRQKIRKAVYERRKKFLDQPCVSPGRQIFQMFSG